MWYYIQLAFWKAQCVKGLHSPAGFVCSSGGERRVGYCPAFCTAYFWFLWCRFLVTGFYSSFETQIRLRCLLMADCLSTSDFSTTVVHLLPPFRGTGGIRPTGGKCGSVGRFRLRYKSKILQSWDEGGGVLLLLRTGWYKAKAVSWLHAVAERG
jgi:hypothetical protein